MRECQRDGQVVIDSSVAEELLPRCRGFFFGGDGYDEYYVNDIVDTIKEMLYDLPNSRYVYNRSYNRMNEISLESFYYKAISMLQDNMQEFGETYYKHLKDNESKIIENLEVIAGDSEDSRIRSNIVQALNILSYNNMSKEMEIITDNWLETLADYNE